KRSASRAQRITFKEACVTSAALALGGQALPHAEGGAWLLRRGGAESIDVAVEHTKGGGRQDRVVDGNVVGPGVSGGLNGGVVDGPAGSRHLVSDGEQGLQARGQGTGVVKAARHKVRLAGQ